MRISEKQLLRGTHLTQALVVQMQVSKNNVLKYTVTERYNNFISASKMMCGHTTKQDANAVAVAEIQGQWDKI